jgi:antitoxin MazE
MSKPLQITIRQIGNSKGVVIPKAILEQVGLNDAVEMSVEGERLVLSKPKNQVRINWADDAKSISKSGEDNLVLGDFANEDDGDWVW